MPSHVTCHITRLLAFFSQLPLGLPTQSLSSRFFSISLIHPTPHSCTAALPRTDASNRGMHPLSMAAHCLNYCSGRRLPSHSPLSMTMLQRHTAMQRHHGLIVLSHSFPGIPSPLPLLFQIHQQLLCPHMATSCQDSLLVFNSKGLNGGLELEVIEE